MMRFSELKICQKIARCYAENLRNYWFNMDQWPKLIMRMFVIQTFVRFVLYSLYLLEVNKVLPFTFPGLGRPYELSGSIDTLFFISLSPFTARLVYSIFWAPVIEEMRYRGIVWLSVVGFRSRWVHALLILSSSMIWSFMHHRAFLGTLEIFIAGILAGIIVVKTRNVIPAIIFHSLWNLMIAICGIFQII